MRSNCHQVSIFTCNSTPRSNTTVPNFANRRDETNASVTKYRFLHASRAPVEQPSKCKHGPAKEQREPYRLSFREQALCAPPRRRALCTPPRLTALCTPPRLTALCTPPRRRPLCAPPRRRPLCVHLQVDTTVEHHGRHHGGHPKN